MFLIVTSATFVILSVMSLIALFQDYETSKGSTKVIFSLMSIATISFTLALLQKVFCGC